MSAISDITDVDSLTRQEDGHLAFKNIMNDMYSRIFQSAGGSLTRSGREVSVVDSLLGADADPEDRGI
jgi:hypothetical protein